MSISSCVYDLQLLSSSHHLFSILYSIISENVVISRKLWTSGVLLEDILHLQKKKKKTNKSYIITLFLFQEVWAHVQPWIPTKQQEVVSRKTCPCLLLCILWRWLFTLNAGLDIEGQRIGLLLFRCGYPVCLQAITCGEDCSLPPGYNCAYTS